MKRLSQQDKDLANKLGIPEEELSKDIEPLKSDDIKWELSEEDRKFVDDIVKEFNVPEHSLANIVYVTGDLMLIIPEKMNHASYKRLIHEDLVRILASPEFKATAIVIETDTNRIYLSSEDPLFHYFNTSINRMRSAFNKEMKGADKQWSKHINGMAMQQLFNYFKYLEQQNISKFNRWAILGLIMVHFGIRPRKPIKSERKWKADKIAGKTKENSYHAYLGSRVRPLLRKYS